MLRFFLSHSSTSARERLIFFLESGEIEAFEGLNAASAKAGIVRELPLSVIWIKVGRDFFKEIFSNVGMELMSFNPGVAN